MSDEEDYGFEYSEDEEEAEDVEIENKYYEAKRSIESDPDLTLKEMDAVIEMEQEQGQWGFKALKQIVKILFRKGQYDEMLKRYKDMLTYVKSAVTRNYSEKKINSILEYVSQSQELSHLEKFYEMTLEVLKEARNERLWFNTKLKLGKLWFDMKVFGRGNAKLEKVLKELHKSCQKEDGSDDLKKGTQLLEIYALEIQMHTETKNTKKLKELYEKALQVKSAIPHPRIMGVIRECGGKMHMTEGKEQDALTDFYEAFKNYDEAGNPRRIQCLKYLVLANMLSDSPINPFDNPEAKPYTDNPEIVAMTSLNEAYRNKEVNELERILAENQESMTKDAFIVAHIQQLLTQARSGGLLRFVQSYSRVSIPIVAKKLSIPEAEIETLLVKLILDGKINGYIDQIQRTLELQEEDDSEASIKALENWTSSLLSFEKTVSRKMG
ncbi:hypothetical protein NDN08_001557 [Rhodosorus marinus]|uniref:PCI domain-containing protein n=1 Tax=Rhodosorus marinus TaxID=101924 RepID=A0AAV8UR46_9RHOD|nr:hypothetical protein NDN08_001557 [Rhodosorus marinus]